MAKLLLLAWLPGLMACSWVQDPGQTSLADYMVSSRVALTARANAETYQPGDAVILTLQMTALESGDPSPQMMPMLDAQSVNFYIRRKEGETYGDVEVVEPVVSQKEKLGGMIEVIPGQSLDRLFVFTRLAFERGDYSLLAVYTYQDPPTDEEIGKAYAQPVFFSVAGQKVSVHRYINGLMTEQEAIERALEFLGTPAARGEAKMILDEKGFYMWWVNAWPEDGQALSCFVNPYLGKVWKKAEPFTEQDESREVPFPADSRLIQQIRQQRGR